MGTLLHNADVVKLLYLAIWYWLFVEVKTLRCCEAPIFARNIIWQQVYTMGIGQHMLHVAICRVGYISMLTLIGIFEQLEMFDLLVFHLVKRNSSIRNPAGPAFEKSLSLTSNTKFEAISCRKSVVQVLFTSFSIVVFFQVYSEMPHSVLSFVFGTRDFPTMDFVDATINAAIDVAEVLILPVYDVNSAGLDYFLHFI